MEPTFLNNDALYNVLLQSDLKTTLEFCSTNQLASLWCKQKSFWIDKFNAFHFYLPIGVDTIKDYIKHFDWYETSNKDAKIILKINHIEKNRNYNQTKGIIVVRIEDMEADDLDLLLNQQFERDDSDDMNFNEIIFELNNQGYFVKLRKWRQYDVNIGYKSLKEVEKLLTYTLTSTGICEDDLDVYFLSMEDELFDKDNIDKYIDQDKLIRLCLRRGLWEGMLSQ